MDGKTINTILITGTSGLVGNAVLAFLVSLQKYNIAAVYHSSKPYISDKSLIFIKADLSTEEGWHEIRKFVADIVIHCAAVIPSSLNESTQSSAKEQNMRMDEYAVSYATNNASKFIYMSTVGIYGFNNNTMCSEDSHSKPAGDYFLGKRASEKKIVSQQGLKYFIFRISSPYGPYQRNETVMSIFIKNSLKNKPLLYYGSGSRMQDFIYVGDIARACILAIENEKYGIYNIASGQPVSMNMLAHIIKKIAESQSEIKAADIEDPQENYRALFNINKAKEFLYWHPQYTLEDGIGEFIAYLKGSSSWS